MFFGLSTQGQLEAVFDLCVFIATFTVFVLTFVHANKIINLLRKSEDRYRTLAYHDFLTGLPNGRLFEEKLNQALKGNRSETKEIAVLYIDLDGFKRVNDTMGHDAGDLLLQEVAKRLKKCVREKDMLSRLAGDEFSVLLHSVAHKEAIFVTERILYGLQAPFKLKDTEVHITPSIGIAFSQNDGDNFETLIKHADIAMYQAKKQGKNNYQIYAKDAS